MYNEFSSFYDEFAYDINYSDFKKYYKKIFEKFNLSPTLVCDMCCGTGTLTTLMSQDYDMIGLDFSVQMLNIAKQKDTFSKILYIKGEMCAFELYGTVDAVYSSLDSVNYILNDNDMDKHFSLVHNYLNQNGLYVFDISTKYKFKNILNDNTFVDETDNDIFIWQNDYDCNECINTMYLDVFSKNVEGTYNRCSEVHTEKGYSPSQIKRFLKKAELECLGVFDGFTFNPPTPKSERIFFVARRTKPHKVAY